MNKFETITSRDNQRLKIARKVRDGKVDDLIFIEGRRLVEEALRSDIVIRECFVSEDFAASGKGNELFRAITERTTDIAEVNNKIFDSIAGTKQSQGIILTAKRPKSSATAINDRLKSRENLMQLVVFLNEINNPSNLGAILRTAKAAGVCGVIVSKNSADVFSPKALRAAMGASFCLPVWDGAEIDEAVYWAKRKGLASTAIDVKGKNAYTETDWTCPRLLIFGSEASGLSETALSSLDEAIRIPMETGVESLNLAVAAGIILYEAKRQNP